VRRTRGVDNLLNVRVLSRPSIPAPIAPTYQTPPAGRDVAAASLGAALAHRERPRGQAASCTTSRRRAPKCARSVGTMTSGKPPSAGGQGDVAHVDAHFQRAAGART
jgi:hypothetical protein